jgi:hypothetical protein
MLVLVIDDPDKVGTYTRLSAVKIAIDALYGELETVKSNAELECTNITDCIKSAVLDLNSNLELRGKSTASFVKNSLT